MKTPDQCDSLQDIRAEIDRLDRQVIGLLGQRLGYVKAAARFKTSEQDMAAPERVEAQVRQLRGWAQEEGLDPGAIERLYRELIAYFIGEQVHVWRAARAARE